MIKYFTQRLCQTALLIGLLFNGQALIAQDRNNTDLGRSIYESGIGRDGREISAMLHGSTALSGAAVACVGCHGKNGRGGGESFIQAPDIRWMNLSKPYSARRVGAAEIPYNPQSFTKALRSGASPSGRKLDPAMPRFDLADDEIHSLIAYLDQIDQMPQGNDHSRPVILGLLPVSGQSSLADALDLKLRNCPAREGNTPIAAVNIIYFNTPEDAISKLDRQLAANPHAILLVPYLAGWEDRYSDAASRMNIQTVLPFSLLDPPARSSWYFPFPGLEAQILALLKSMKEDGYTQLRIRYEPEDPLSTKLDAFARSVALFHHISVIPENFREKEQTKSAWLWLKPVDGSQIDAESASNELMLVPALFFKPNKREVSSKEKDMAEWRIAYPYKPDAGENGTWRAPVDIWASAACEFLALAGAKSIDLKNLPGILKWEKDLFLYMNPDSDQLSGQVFIYKLP